MENPEPLAGLDVKAPHVSNRARRGGLASHCRMRGAHHDHIPGDQRRGVQSDHRADQVEILIVILLQIDDAFLAERLDQMPRFRIQRDHLISRRNENDPLIRAIGARPVGHSSPGASTRRELAALAFVELVHPQHLTCARVQRHDGTGAPGGGVKDPVHHQGRGGIEPVRSRPEVIRIQPPGDLEFAEVVLVDLIQRRVARARQVSSVGGPLTFAGGREAAVAAAPPMGRLKAALPARMSFAFRM